jgi:iron complex outermembrane receptor protein
MHRKIPGSWFVGEHPEGDNPRHQFQIRNSFELTPALRLNGALYFTGRLNSQNIPRYTRVDVNASWWLSDALSIAGGIQNALSPRHMEFVDKAGLILEAVERGPYAKLTYWF